MNLRNHLLSSFGAIVLVLVLIVVSSGLILYATRNTLDSIKAQRFYKEQKINNARVVILTIQGEVLHTAMFRDSSYAGIQKRLDELARSFYDLLRDLERVFPEKRRELNSIYDTFQSYYIFAKRALILTQGALASPDHDVLRLFREREKRLLLLMDQAFSSCERELDTSFLDLGKHLDYLFFMMLGLAGLGSFSALVLSLGLSRRLSRPIRDLICNVRLMEQGKEVSITNMQQYQPIEELGELAATFERMARNVKQKQDSLITAERRYREIFENAAQGIIQSTPEGLVLHANPAFAQMLGYASMEEARSAINKLKSQVYVKPEDRDRFLELLRRGEVVHAFETQLHRKDSSVIWVRIHAQPIFDDSGRLQRIETILEDISEARIAKEALRQYHMHLEDLVHQRTLALDQRNEELRMAVEALEFSNQWLQGLLDNSPSFIFLKDTNNAFILANTRFQETFSQEIPLRGKNNADVFQGEILRFFNELDDLFAQGTTEVQEDKTLQLPDALMAFQVMLFPFLDQSGIIKGHGCMLTDVTKEKILQRENIHAAQLASIGGMAAGVAHEINNPVNGIINYAQLLLDSGMEQGAPWARNIITEAERVAAIVRSLLSFARKPGTYRTRAKVEDIILECLKLTGNDLRIHDIELVLAIEPDLPEVLVNFTEIQQVFLNLIFNARQAMDDKPPGTEERNLRIEAFASRTEHGNTVRICFLDSGLGMPEATARRIFEPFFTTRSASSGIGLGLFLSHKIVTDHGGRMEVQSKEGIFTRMTVILPAEQRAGEGGLS